MRIGVYRGGTDSVCKSGNFGTTDLLVYLDRLF